MRKLLFTVVVALLVLAGCGGTDDNQNNNDNANLDNNNTEEVNNEENNDQEANENDDGDVDLSSLDALTAEEVLEEDPDADIFQYEGVIYKTDGELAEDVGLTQGGLIGKIDKKDEDATEFEDGLANELMPNVKIYETNEEDLTTVLVEVRSDLYVYYAQVNE